MNLFLSINKNYSVFIFIIRMLSDHTALSTHTACFFCRDKNKLLKTVKKKTLFLLIVNIKSISKIMQDAVTPIMMKMVLYEKRNLI
jgi:hypothetical protein